MLYLIVGDIIILCHWEPFKVILNVSDNLCINIIFPNKTFNASYIIIDDIMHFPHV